MIMTGYTANKSRDTYQVYNPRTQKVTERRDVTWLDWNHRSISLGMDIFDDLDQPVPSTPLDFQNLLPDDKDDDQPPVCSHAGHCIAPLPRPQGGRIVPLSILDVPFGVAPDPVKTGRGSMPKAVLELQRMTAEEAREIREQLQDDDSQKTPQRNNLTKTPGTATRIQPGRTAKTPEIQPRRQEKTPVSREEHKIDPSGYTFQDKG